MVHKARRVFSPKPGGKRRSKWSSTLRVGGACFGCVAVVWIILVVNYLHTSRLGDTHIDPRVELHGATPHERLRIPSSLFGMPLPLRMSLCDSPNSWFHNLWFLSLLFPLLSDSRRVQGGNVNSEDFQRKEGGQRPRNRQKRRPNSREDPWIEESRVTVTQAARKSHRDSSSPASPKKEPPASSIKAMTAPVVAVAASVKAASAPAVSAPHPVAPDVVRAVSLGTKRAKVDSSGKTDSYPTHFADGKGKYVAEPVIGVESLSGWDPRPTQETLGIHALSDLPEAKVKSMKWLEQVQWVVENNKHAIEEAKARPMTSITLVSALLDLGRKKLGGGFSRPFTEYINRFKGFMQYEMPKVCV
jgi:hypothetical protein